MEVKIKMGTKLFLVEDAPEFMNLLKIMLGEEGHKVLFTAATRQQALDMVEAVKKADVKVAILDGGLGTSSYSGEDGFLVAQALRKEMPGIRVISFSLDNMTWGDKNVKKPEFTDLVKAIEELSS